MTGSDGSTALINNAGIYIGKSFTDYTLEDYAAITAVNLTGFFHITQRAIRQMVDQGGGHIVNISTSLVDHPDSTRPCALAALTKGGSRRRGAVAGDRVRVTRHPGRTRSPSESSGRRCTTRRATRAWAALHPLGRVGEIDDVVDGVLYLERATFVTGETFHIDGGQAAGG